MVDQISMAAPTPQEDTISLGTGSSADANYLLSPQTIANRSFKAAYGLANTQAAQPQADIHSSIETGNENSSRNQAATQLNTQVAQDTNRAIIQRIQNTDRSIQPQDVNWIRDAYFNNFNYEPNSVYEMAFANQYMSELGLYAGKVGSSVYDMMGDQTAMKVFGTVNMAQHQYLLTKAQNVQSQIDNQSTLGYSLDTAKIMFPFLNPYYELKMRGNVEGTGFTTGGLLGSNLEEQRNVLLNQPFNNFTSEVDRITDHLAKDNPQAALAFLSSMMGQTASEKVLNQINTVGNFMDLPLVLGAARAIGRPIYTSFSIANQTRQAYKSMLQAQALIPEATPETIAASVGDIPTAAKIKAATLIAAGKGDVTETGLQQLPIHMRVDMANLEKNPASFSQTFVNALLEQYKTGYTNFLNKMTDTTRPFTVPFENLPPEVMEEIAKNTYERYPGMSNSIIKFEDFQREPISRRGFITAWIGRRAGEFFDSEDEAMQYARLHQIPLSYTPEQVANLEARITALKDAIKEGPDMHDDTAGLNHFYGLEKQLKDIQEQLAYAKTAPQGNSTIQGLKKVKDTSDLDKKITDLKQQIREYPVQDADTAGLNHYNQLEQELKDTQAQRATIDQQGLGYYLKITKPIDETSPLVRSFVYNKERPESVSPDSWTKYIPYFNFARTPEDTMSAENRLNRLAAVYPQGRILELMEEEGKNLAGLKKDERKIFTDVLKFSQDKPDRDTGVPGEYFRNLQELSDHYLTVYGRAPNEREAQAYFAIKRWSEYDHMFREIKLFGNKTRWGAEAQKVIADGVPSSAFEGRSMNHFPGGSGANVLVVGDNFASSELQAIERIPVSQKEAWTKLIKEGKMKLIQLWDPESTPFNGLVEDGNKLTHYVLAKNIETTPLSWQQLPFRGGGHHVYEAPLYLKVPVMRYEQVKGAKRSVYLGDRTVLGINFSKDGRDLADKFNQVGVLIANNKMEAAKAFYETHMGAFGPWNEFKAKWFPVRDANGVMHEPVFNPEFFRRPGGKGDYFRVLPKGKSISQMDDNLTLKFGSEFIDGTREHSPARNFQVEFTGERDADKLRTAEFSNGVYNFRTAEKVDPVKIMTRGISSIVHSTFTDDYKTYAIETWLREANEHVKPEWQSRFISSPFWAFKNVSENTFLAGTTPQRIEQLMANKFKIEQLIGTPSKLDTFIATGAQALADSLYTKTGSSKLTVVPTWVLPRLKDPFSFLRSVAFNAYLGFGYLPQFFVQSMGFVNIHAISPLHAPAGTLGMYLYQLSRVNGNPEIMRALDKMASTVHVPGFARFRPGEWMEALEEMEKTGFAHVAGEVAQLATLGKTGVYKYGLGNKILTLGQTPFREGERAVRLGAWFTAYLEYRAEHAAGAISEMDRSKILQRADLLYGNMSTASNSMLHTGILSLPTQFYSYTLRLAEQFWGKRLGETATERALARARLVAYNSALFGVPVGLGVSGLPIGDWMRQKMLEESSAADKGNLQYVTGTPLRWLRSLTGTTKPYSVVNVNDSDATAKDWIEHMFMEGFPSTGLYLATGNHYNIGPRYGLNGAGFIKDMIFGDPGFWQLIGGASGNIVANTFGPNKDGFVKVMGSILNKDGVQWKAKTEDFLNIIKEIQSVKKFGLQLPIALNTGKWVNNNSQYVQDVSKLNAVFMSITGLQPQLQSDIFNITANLKSQVELQKYASKRASEEMSKGFLALGNKDPDNADDYFKRAVVWLIAGDVPDKMISQTLSRSVGQNRSTIDRAAWTRYVQNAPQGREQEYYRVYSLIHNSLQGPQ